MADERARDVVRYIKVIQDTGGIITVKIPGAFGRVITQPTYDRFRAEMLNLADKSDEELAAGYERAGIISPPLHEIRARIASYR